MFGCHGLVEAGSRSLCTICHSGKASSKEGLGSSRPAEVALTTRRRGVCTAVEEQAAKQPDLGNEESGTVRSWLLLEKRREWSRATSRYVFWVPGLSRGGWRQRIG